MKLRLPNKLQAAIVAACAALALNTTAAAATTGTATFAGGTTYDKGTEIVTGLYLTSSMGTGTTTGTASAANNGILKDGSVNIRGGNFYAKDYTVSIWVTMDSLASNQLLFAYGASNPTSSISANGIYWDASAKTFRIGRGNVNSTYDGMSWNSPDYFTTSSMADKIGDGEMVNITFAVTGGDQAMKPTLWVNGTEVWTASTTYKGNMNNDTNPMKLYVGSGVTYGNVTITDEKVMSQSDIYALMGVTSATPGTEKHFVWTGAQGSAWDTETANWVTTTAQDPVNFESGDDNTVTFNAAGEHKDGITLSAAASVKAVTVDSAAYTLNLGGFTLTTGTLAVTGEGGSLTLNGNGTVTLTGQTDLNTSLSHVKLGSDSKLALTAGDKSVINLSEGSAGTLEVKGGSVSYHSNLGGATLQLDAGTTFYFDNKSTDSSETHTYTGNIALGGNVDIQVYGTSQHPTGVTITGNISGSGKTLTKKDLGNLTVNGNVVLGTLDVQNGNVTINGISSGTSTIGSIKAAQGKTLELTNVTATTINQEGRGDGGYVGNLVIGNGAVVLPGRTDGWGFERTNTLTVKTGGKLDMKTTRWTFQSTNTIELAGGEITGQGDATYGALDFNGSNTVKVTENSILSANLRVRSQPVTFEVAAGKNLDFSGNVVNQGNGGITKTGDGTLTMSGTTYSSSPITLSAGTLKVAGANSLGGGSVTQSGGVLEIAETVDLSSKLTQTAGSIKVAENGALTLNNVTLAGALSVETGGTLTLTGTTLAGSIANAGTVNLSGTIAATDLEAGDVQIKYKDASGNITDHGNGFKQSSGTYYVVKGEGELHRDGTVNVGFAGGTHELQENGQIQLAGDADLTAYYMQEAGTTENYSAIKAAAEEATVGTIHLNAANTSVVMDAASTGVSVAVADGISAQLTISADTTLGNIHVATEGTQLTVGGTSTLTLGAGSLTGAGKVAFNGPTTSLTGANSGFTGIVSVMGGTVTLSDSNALTSATVNVGENGTLVLAVHGTNDNGAGMPSSITGNGTVKITDNNFQYHAAGYLETFAGKVLIADNGLVHMGNKTNKFAAATLEVATNGTLHGWGATFTHNIVLSGGTLGDDNDNQTYSGAITLTANTNSFVTATSGKTVTLSGVISGEGGLTISGPGTVVLSGTNTYTGKTEVQGGTLNITGTINPASEIVVAADATLTGSGADAKKVGIASGATATFTGAITGDGDGVSFSRQGGVQVTNTREEGDPLQYALSNSDLRVTAAQLTANSTEGVEVANQLAVTKVENTGTGALSLTTGRDLSAIKEVFAISGDIHFLNVGNDAQALLSTLDLAAGRTVSFNTGAVAGETDEATVTVAGMLVAGGPDSKLNANLVMGGAEGSPAVLDVHAMRGIGGLNMGSSVTLASGNVALSDEDMEMITGLEFGGMYDLFNGVDSFNIGSNPYGYTDAWVKASDVFTNQGLIDQDYYLFYSGANQGGVGGNVGTIYIMQMPEPTTGTLSLLALCALAARRRRK